MHGFGRSSLRDSAERLANTGFTIDVSPSIAIPERTVTLDGKDFTVDAIGKVAPGDSITVSVTADDPSKEYTIQIRDPEEYIQRLSDTFSGDSSVTFDTGPTSDEDALLPRSFGAAAVDSGNIMAFHPLVVTGYEVTVRAPSGVMAGDDVEVTATIGELPSEKDVPAVDHLETVVWTADSENRQTMTAVDSDTYRKTLQKSADDYNLSVAVITTEPSPDNDPEPVGFSDPGPLSFVSVADDLAQDWSVSTEHRLQFAGPAVGTEEVFVGGLGRAVIAHDRSASGGRNWSFDRDGSLSDASPVLAKGTLFVASGGGTLSALDPDASEGQRVAWQHSVDSAITSTPAVANGTVYAGTNDGRVLARDATDGSSLWTTTVGGPVYSDLDASTDRVFVTTADGDVVALSTNGTEAWRERTSGRLGPASPVYRDGTVYVAGEDFLALDSATGEVQWRVDDYAGGAGATPAVVGGTVYVGDANGRIRALDAAAGGAWLWSFVLADGVPARPGVGSDRVVVADLAGTVGVLDRSTGAWLKGRTLPDPVRSPVVVDSGDAFVGTRGGDVRVFENV